MVDYLGDVVKDTDVMGRAKIVPVFPERTFPLIKEEPHRTDCVGRAFVIDGRASDGETWIYRELYWEVTPCRCQDER
jgi:hypothetical protein